MRVLYVDANVCLINPTANYSHYLSAMFSDVRFYGPGFVEEPDLVSGLGLLQILRTFRCCWGPRRLLGETGFDADCNRRFLAATHHTITRTNLYWHFR